jgi:hypothetical protein
MRYILFVALIGLFISSCSDKSSTLIGRWELDEIDYTEHYKSIPEEARSMIREAMNKAFKKLKGKTFFTFSENEKLTLEAPNFLNKVKRTKGNWKMNDTQDSLRIIIADEVENYRIVQINADSLILSTTEVPARTLILLRQKWKD